jgi:U6 snRNA-associated Sm-like protein LSm7
MSKKNILDLAGQVDKKVRVTFQGGREVVGVLKGFDDIVNLVLDDTIEYFEFGTKARKLGRVVVRGPQVSLVSPEEGFQQIENPFAADEEEATEA